MIPKITCIRRTIFFQYGAIYYILPAPLFTFCDFVKVKRNHRRAVMHCHETPHAAQKSFGNLLLKILVILFYKPATTNKQYIRLILGEILSERIAEKLGAKVLVQISQNLQKQLPGLRGFPPTNLKNMKQFHAEYQILIFSQSLTGQLRKRRKSSKTETARLPGIRHPPLRCLVASLKRLLHLTRLPRQQPPLPLLLLPHQQHRQIRVARLTPIIRSGG